MRAAAALLCLVLWLPLAGVAQDTPPPAMLVADSVRIESERLIAEGNVETLYDGTRLTATRIIYDRATDRLVVEGPVRLTDSEGNIIVADSAALDRDLENGILRGARMVLDRQLQLAAARIDRVNGRYAQLSRVAVTSCQVCGKAGTPLWQIRARRVIHDAEERQLYFDHAQFRILDVPVFYLPRLRLPDPTLKRARGFLIPTSRSTTRLGLGIKLPYFIPLGDHRDLTITPYLSPVTRTVEFRYRQAFAKGDLTVRGAATRDTLLRDETRGYLFLRANFDLRRNYKLEFDIEATTDDAYLADYDYSGKDRLDSAITLSRTQRHRYFRTGLLHYESLRDGEDNATQPTLIGDLLWERRYFPRRLGGEARLKVQGHSHFRYSDADIVGRDVSRLNIEASWRRRWTLAGGLRLGLQGQLAGDFFRTRQDSGARPRVAQLTPAALVELRWPLTRTGARGARHLLEPLVQLGWTGGTRPRIANDESTRVELDEASLLSLSRFPVADRRERGRAAALGIRWLRHDPAGWTAGLTLGQVIRDSVDPDFTASSGLDARRSDLLLAGHLHSANGLELMARSLMTPTGDVTKAEARASWHTDRLSLAASYLLLREDPGEDRSGTISEWSLDSAYRIGRHWTTSAEWRYDLASDRTARAGLGLEYRNECIEVDFSVSRRFTSSSSLEPSTDFGLTVALKGFSTGGSGKTYRRTCRN